MTDTQTLKLVNYIFCFLFPTIVPITFRLYLNKLAEDFGQVDRFNICTARVFAEMIAMFLLTLFFWIPAVIVALMISIKRENKMSSQWSNSSKTASLI